MSNSRTRIPSPARSMPITPRRREPPRKTRSVCSPARSTASGRLSCLIREHREQIGSLSLSPMSRKSVLTDNTDIEELGRKSWWRDLGDHSREVMEVLKDDNAEPFNIFENIEVLSQEEKHHTLADLSDSSNSESIQSIIMPQRKLFREKENQPQKTFNPFSTRETLDKLHKENAASDKTVSNTAKNLFQTKSKPVIPVNLSTFSNTSSDKTMTVVSEKKRHVHNFFNMQQNRNLNHQNTLHKKMFAKFIESDSEDEIPEIRPKFFALQKNTDSRRPSVKRRSSRGVDNSMASSIDIEDWQLLPSSTMLDYELNTSTTTGQPSKRSKLSKLSENEMKDPEVLNKIQEDQNKSQEINIGSQMEQNESQKLKNKSQDLHNETVTKDNINDADNIKNHRLQNKSHEINNETIEKDNINEAEDNEYQREQHTNQEIHSETVKKNNINEEENNESQKLQNKHLKIDSETIEKDNIKQAENNECQREQHKKQEICSETVGKDNINGAENNESQNVRDKHKEIQSETLEKDNINEAENNISGRVDKSQDVHIQNVEKDHKNGTKNNESQEDVNEIKDAMEQNKNDICHNATEDNVNESQGEIEQNENVEENNINQNKIEDNANESEEKIKQNENKDENGVNRDKIEDDVNGTQEEIEQNEEENNIQDKIEDDVNESQEEIEQNESVNEEEIEDENESQEEIEQNETVNEEDNNETQEEIEDENESEEEVEQHESENEEDNNETREEIEDENESQEDMEHNESEVDREMDYEEDNESLSDENDLQNQESNSDHVDNQENDMELENSHKSTGTITEQHDSDENDNPENSDDDQIENSNTLNVSHDTAGRNKKKSVTPEAVLRKTRNELDATTFPNQNTSYRSTKSMNRHQSMEFFDGSKNSSDEGSGWDSHRTTRKTLRQTFGKDFSIRKSLRAMVIAKTAKARMTTANDATMAEPQANSTEFPEPDMTMNDNEMQEPIAPLEVSTRTKQATIRDCLERAKKRRAEEDAKMEEEIKKRLEQGRLRVEDPFKIPTRPVFQHKTLLHKPKPKTKNKNNLQGVKVIKNLPEEFIEDLNYKPPKRFAPRNAAWLTKRLYKYLETKLEPKYNYKARVRAEKFAQDLYEFVQPLRKRNAPFVAPQHAVDGLKREMARLNIVQTHFEFDNFVSEFLPLEVRQKVVPDIVNKIPHPRTGIFSNIL